MRFYDIDGDRTVALEQVAAALRPLLAQPAPADVHAVPHPDWSTAPDWAQWWAVDPNGDAYWYSERPHCGNGDWRSPTHLVALAEADTGPCPTWAATLTPRRAAEPTEAEQVRYWKDAAAAARLEALFAARDEVAALDAAKQRAELQLADARQEIEQLRAANAEMYRTMTAASNAAADAGEEVCRVRAEVADARRLQDQYSADARRLQDQYRSEWIAASTRANVAANERDAARRELADAIDAHAAELGAARSALTLAQIAVETVTVDRDEWREAALASAHKVAVAREALGAE